MLALTGALDRVYRQTLGRRAEDLACAALTARGYRIVDRRFRTQWGELDIVAREGETLVFVEVRARVGEDYGSAEESITARKEWRITRMAQAYLSLEQIGDVACRFDVVAVDMSGLDPVLTIYQSAFDARGDP